MVQEEIKGMRHNETNIKGCQKILDICDKVGKIDKVNETIGSKFEESPF